MYQTNQYEGMIAETVTLQGHKGETINAYIARPLGSVPEIIAPGLSGFVVDTLDEMVDAVKRVDAIDRAACRRHVEERFSVERMADGYEAIYRRLTAVSRAA